jgi:UDP-2,3-diacylglucosamine hydrolase
MRTIFISDLHLIDNQEMITRSFLKFLAEFTISGDTLYILGDLFEVWIGDDDLNSFNSKIIQCLKEATTKGLKIYIIPGNRDFLLGNDFFKMTGCNLLPEPCIIKINNIPIIIMHGDLLCTDDLNYLRYRKIVHSKFIQFLFLLMPLRWRREISKKMRNKSKNHMQKLDPSKMDVNQEAVKQLMSKLDAYILIHGHTHLPGIHDFMINGKQAKRIVLGAWHERGSALICSNADDPITFELIEI